MVNGVTARNILGERFGRLTVIRWLRQNKHRQSIYTCICDCGKEVEILRNSLITKRTTSCGCYRKEVAKESPYNYSQLLKQGKLRREGSKWLRVQTNP